VSVAGLPSASIDTCAPPPVASRTVVSGVIAISAPHADAIASASGDTSTATTRAPAAAAIITADSPTPPQPYTASHSPGRTRPRATTARNAVAKRHPSAAAVRNVTSSGSRTRLVSARRTTTKSANEPQ